MPLNTREIGSRKNVLFAVARIVSITMFSKQVLNRITTFPEEKQLQLVKCTSDFLNQQLIEDCREDLLETCSEREVERILEVIAHLSYLYRSNNRNKFLEMTEELSIPQSIRSLYLQEGVVLKQLYIPYDYKWRIDISVPKANAILINISRGGEEQVCFRLDVSTYHKLRFNIALLLKELNNLRRNHMRLKKF